MFKLDDRELYQLDRKLARAGAVFTPSLMSRTFRENLKPMLAAAKQFAPVGKRKNRSTLTRRTRAGKTKRDGTYDRGGSTRRDLRILVNKGKDKEIVRGLVGVNMKKGHVGWRTHFITRPTRKKPQVNDFLDRAEKATLSEVVNRFGNSAETIVQKVLAKG